MIENHINPITQLESFFVLEFRPHFLSIVCQPDLSPPEYNVMIFSHIFKGMSIADRITYIFSLLKEKNPDILSTNVVIVEAFTASELEDLIEYTFI